MSKANLEKVLGSGMLHEGAFGSVIRQHFPTATALDLYGAGVNFNLAGEIVSISCQGRTVPYAAPDSQEKK